MQTAEQNNSLLTGSTVAVDREFQLEREVRYLKMQLSLSELREKNLHNFLKRLQEELSSVVDNIGEGE